MSNFTIDTAIAMAAEAHAGQVDKAGQPYILHPIRVMMHLPTIKGKMAAVLHDVVEDTGLSLDDLRRAGCPADVVGSIDCVTKRAGEKGDYDTFIQRVIDTGDHLAVQVKIADINDNNDPARLLYLDADKRDALSKKYTRALRRLLYEC